MQTSAMSHTRQGLGSHTLSAGRLGGAPAQRQVMVTTRAMSDKLLKKPELRRPELPQRPDVPKPQQPDHAAAPTAAAPAAAPSSSDGVTIEWQRQRAKEMRQYFQDKQLEAQAKTGQMFGWTPSNEIGNGRWVMFGVFVGLLTEYATGVDFPNQIRLMLTYLGIADLD